MQREVHRVVEVVIEVGAGADHEVHQPAVDELDKAAAKPCRGESAGNRQPDGRIGRRIEHLAREDVARLRQPGGVEGLEAAVHEVADGGIALRPVVPDGLSGQETGLWPLCQVRVGRRHENLREIEAPPNGAAPDSAYHALPTDMTADDCRQATWNARRLLTATDHWLAAPGARHQWIPSPAFPPTPRCRKGLERPISRFDCRNSSPGLLKWTM